MKRVKCTHCHKEFMPPIAKDGSVSRVCKNCGLVLDMFRNTKGQGK